MCYLEELLPILVNTLQYKSYNDTFFVLKE